MPPGGGGSGAGVSGESHAAAAARPHAAGRNGATVATPGVGGRPGSVTGPAPPAAVTARPAEVPAAAPARSRAAQTSLPAAGESGARHIGATRAAQPPAAVAPRTVSTAAGAPAWFHCTANLCMITVLDFSAHFVRGSSKLTGTGQALFAKVLVSKRLVAPEFGFFRFARLKFST